MDVNFENFTINTHYVNPAFYNYMQTIWLDMKTKVLFFFGLTEKKNLFNCSYK